MTLKTFTIDTANSHPAAAHVTAGGHLVIVVSKEYLKHLVETDDNRTEYNEDCDSWDGVKVVDDYEWLQDVANSLNREEDDGSTPVCRMLDDAFTDAIENGSAAVILPGED